MEMEGSFHHQAKQPKPTQPQGSEGTLRQDTRPEVSQLHRCQDYQDLIPPAKIAVEHLRRTYRTFLDLKRQQGQRGVLRS